MNVAAYDYYISREFISFFCGSVLKFVQAKNGIFSGIAANALRGYYQLSSEFFVLQMKMF